MRVLIVTNMYPHERDRAWGTFVKQQVEALRSAGQIVDVLHIQGHKSTLRYITAALEVFARTRRTSYDIVHAHYGLSGVPALFRLNAPLVVTVHGSDALRGIIQPVVTRFVCMFADAVIVVSKEIQTIIPGQIIPCGIDLKRFRPGDRAAARARLGLPTDRRFVLFPYDRSRKVKRYELAAAAIAHLQDETVECLSVSGISNEEMPWYYQSADALLLCSESEGSPTSVKEALACNIPIVSTNVGDVAEVLKDIAGCELCEPVAESLAAGLRRVLYREGQSFQSRAAVRKYDHKQVANAILTVYNGVIQGRRAGSSASIVRTSGPV